MATSGSLEPRAKPASAPCRPKPERPSWIMRVEPDMLVAAETSAVHLKFSQCYDSEMKAL